MIMVLRNVPSFSAVNFWPALLDVVTAAFMVFVLSTYLQLVMTLRVGAEDAEAARVRALEAQSQLAAAAGSGADGDAALAAIEHAPWPGGVRQLAALCEAPIGTIDGALSRARRARPLLSPISPPCCRSASGASPW